ncbi:MAG: aldolase/citrate lyase family protein [Chloroflexi bacterium]|nr:aldolase/citrate lyase family protein [Chloroflexota bacterium]MDA1297997.1 aldolase/citrate lyase family protein [Chloroflexota bacterium]
MHGLETLRERIRSGEKIAGCSVRMWATRSDIDEALALGDYSYIAVDAQHSPFSEHALVNVCGTANGMGIPVQLRIKHTRHTYLIGNMLDLGPSMIEVPQTEELETVREAVDNFNYPLKGRRSWGPSGGVAADERPDRLEYAKWWNDHGLLWVQLETILGVTRAAQMAALGADVLSWGPNDLAFDRERFPAHPLKTDDDCIEHVLTQLDGTGTKLCLRTYSQEQMDRYSEMGVTMFLDERRLFRAPS